MHFISETKYKESICVPTETWQARVSVQAVEGAIRCATACNLALVSVLFAWHRDWFLCDSWSMRLTFLLHLVLRQYTQSYICSTPLCLQSLKEVHVTMNRMSHCWNKLRSGV